MKGTQDQANLASEPRVFRFAPSPNGFLHLGHAYSALLNFELARTCGGRFLLRTEDIDLARARPDYEAAIYEDLAWLGLDWERPVRRQSEHFADYAAALERLDAMGLVYPCACTRSEIAKAAGPDPLRDPDGAPLYPGTCRGNRRESLREILKAGGVALRLDMAKAMNVLGAEAGALSWREHRRGDIPAHPERWGDVVLARKDTPTSYHLAVVVDDALQGVTNVVRGADLLPATGLHRLLQGLLGLPAPSYRHHALLLCAEGEKLSKSKSSKTLRDLRAEGMSAAAVREAARPARDVRRSTTEGSG
ncbi:tRNA glutamyl-Q(34) synthetase GluQRS [Methylocystis bryophila]|uniref:tRNA glutamyl-Q(34) synthetase GluQRS n=1 Tax=Methylocystis bryophila TaxID=655015 RepID=A0A1W6MQY7_9HYPH|nr:tRNA glutamyl-Q(34) synthetase GluQRS [Methylocystis bryophila]ARN80020.1 tRNA glutamyl-Q(34) synthetase GluQRS [Methylocystis bryophila]BDV39931.1 tRNA glutamyl-Q(34) synthetase GluQRS [Methylocystis bryophila]